MKAWIFPIFVFISSVAYGQSTECKDFRNGKFVIHDDEHGKSYIERKGSRQIEYGEGSKLKMEFKVKWVDDCTYTLELKKVLENPENIKLPEGMILTIKIIEAKENSYVQETSSNMFDFVLKSEMFRME